jgi:DNA-binding response OmpR family regulator
MSCKILIVEDDADINSLLEKMLSANGYAATSAYSGSEANLLLKNENFDCILLDLMLPGVDGEKLIENIRKQFTMPIIVISAKLGTDARVTTLRLGADDFISKPFENEEVLARVEAQLRRSQVFSLQTSTGNSNVYRHKNCVLDSGALTAAVNGRMIELTSLEYQILALLMKNPKRVFTRDNIFSLCWEKDYVGEDNTVDVHISHIRNKIAAHDDEEYIKTVRGIGYRLSN